MMIPVAERRTVQTQLLWKHHPRFEFSVTWTVILFHSAETSILRSTCKTTVLLWRVFVLHHKVNSFRHEAAFGALYTSSPLSDNLLLKTSVGFDNCGCSTVVWSFKRSGLLNVDFIVQVLAKSNYWGFMEDKTLKSCKGYGLQDVKFFWRS